MPGRTARAAFDSFVGPIQQALSCVTIEQLKYSHDARQPGAVRSVALPPGANYIQLPGELGLKFHASIEYELAETDDAERGPWKVRTRQYRYHVVTADQTEVLLYHWHPDSTPQRPYPHLHVGSTQLTANAVISGGDHIPTGRVALESVIRLLITEFAVAGRRDDWSKVLEDAEQRFIRWRTWS